MTTAELAGIVHEFSFWKDFVRSARFRDHWLSDAPNPELREQVRDFLLEQPGARVLDVGSGVVSLLHGTVPRDLLTAVDPLAGLYAMIFDYAAQRIEPPLPQPVEDLDLRGRLYDVVHMSNALDHCQDPVAAMKQLHIHVKRGGWIVIQGFEMEGSRQRWEGFHQWNISADSRGTLWAFHRVGEPIALCTGGESAVMDRPHGRWFVWTKRI